MTSIDQSEVTVQRSELLRLLIGGWVSSAVAAAVELGIADALHPVPQDASSVAIAVGADPESTSRLLRLLQSLDLLHCDTEDRFSLTALGELLHPGHPQSMCRLVQLYDEQYFADAWRQLVPGLRTGEQPFTRAHGQTVFEYLANRPDELARYSAGIAVGSGFVAVLPELLDFGGESVMDVGGGDGTLLDTILAANPDTTGILVERPVSVDAASVRLEQHLTGRRCTVVSGDFFDTLPGGADTIVLCRILHNWNDDQTRTILRNCRAALGPRGRLLIIERVLSQTSPTTLTTAFDLHMLVMTSGRERTDAQYRALLADSGFELTTIHALPMEMGVVEGHAR